MKILIIEDEHLVAVSLKQLLAELAPDATIEGPLPSVAEAISYFSSNTQPDLVLSDIQLSDGIAFDIFNQVEARAPIIFTTAYNEYAIRAFKLNSIDYLLKPIEKSELSSALEKFYRLQSKYANDDYMRQMIALFKDFRNAKKYKERFSVNVGRSVTLIPVDEIALFIKEELIYAVNREGRRFITDYRSLDEIQELVDPSLFYRGEQATPGSSSFYRKLPHRRHLQDHHKDEKYKGG